MNTELLITLLRKEVEKTGVKCYSPDFPSSDGICSSIRIDNGTHERNLSTGKILYSNLSMTILVRGNTNDKETRKIADKVFNQLDMKTLEDDTIRVSQITCSVPNYAFRDENQRIHYNIDCSVMQEWRK